MTVVGDLVVVGTLAGVGVGIMAGALLKILSEGGVAGALVGSTQIITLGGFAFFAFLLAPGIVLGTFLLFPRGGGAFLLFPGGGGAFLLFGGAFFFDGGAFLSAALGAFFLDACVRL